MTNSYFLGSSAANGFFSIFDELTPKADGQFTYVIKGGPGTGKSSFMKRVAETLEAHDIECERIFCSSDPDSLDGIIVPSLRVSLADGTSPHTIDPKYPGASAEILNLGDFWNKKMLRDNAENIIKLTDKNKECHKKCRKFISTAFSLYADGEKLCRGALDREKLNKYASRLAARSIKKVSTTVGREKRRMLDAITPKGYVFMSDTANGLCDNKIIFRDDFGVAAEILINELKEYAKASGYSVISSPNAMGRTRHIIIKELSVGFFTSDCFCTVELENARMVSLKRFYDSNVLSEHKARLAFTKKAANELMDEAIQTLAAAKTVHDELEKCYIEAMDFDGITALADSVSKNILAGEWYPEE